MRGAVHWHGTAWLNFVRLEKLVWNNEGHLSHPVSMEEDADQPLKGLSDAFKKLRHNDKLEMQDISCLTTFVDEFSTVTTDPAVVGEDVAEIVTEVNQHHHTKTCRKRSSVCRFNFPKVFF